MSVKILVTFGTRPEGIKLAPLIREFQRHPHLFDVFVCVTGQHREMLDQVLNLFDIAPDYDLNIMRKGEDLHDLTARILLAMKHVFTTCKPDVVFVHGDTTTSLAVSLAAFYQNIPVAHVEAGLRTHNRYSPWPEEVNRQLTSRLATFHLAPTCEARRNLLNENITNTSIIVTGNTVIDSLKSVVGKITNSPGMELAIIADIQRNGYDVLRLIHKKRLVLITGHRRENFGEGFSNICLAIKSLALSYPDVDFVYPVHLNPGVQEPVNRLLSPENINNLFLITPLDYLSFVYLMKSAYLILTDSGGIQEEAPSLGKPVLVMRDTTERPEAVDAGIVKLVGTNMDSIVKNVRLLLDDWEVYTEMAMAHNPYGDGKACARIVNYFIEKNQSYVLTT
ncbi:UDP-N-acetylglucosamine 2-epimerase (non-hydrolyzing) [Spirosoma sp. BT702]|uniref:UDP-N-acetylglucosamine 2-epimerase (non-hydrolyzing) n=1 Tax=Spirosoma profusum TaxID=2771354 RepID=A0A927AQK2_9BACT|nr:UDP-N-acetylglucosamine 2-epimerase (non-hydrolyzing) [Spirosoma profusum]MBD2700693.1 UDP-N-acetylglucosamine 2-epimerase (non-hydrolyzing) [Spirosoma profusum]